MAEEGFGGRRVLALESRWAPEMEAMIARHGGRAVVAPAVREVPVESNREALDFISRLIDGKFDVVIFLTGVGVRVLTEAAAATQSRDTWVEALKRVTIVARGPKPAVALRELGVAVTVPVPEPNTWREVLAALDERAASAPLAERRVAVQEHGEPSRELASGLAARGAAVTPVRVYRWELPEDLTPLRNAVSGVAKREVDVVLFTSSIQARHLLYVAAEMKLEDAVRHAFTQTVVGSIGPTTSEELRRHGIEPDFEPAHPKMGHLVKEAAERSAAILRRKLGASGASL